MAISYDPLDPFGAQKAYMQALYQQQIQNNQYAQKNIGGLASYLGSGTIVSSKVETNTTPPKPSKRGYIAKLRAEIDDWHGDILAA